VAFFKDAPKPPFLHKSPFSPSFRHRCDVAFFSCPKRGSNLVLKVRYALFFSLFRFSKSPRRVIDAPRSAFSRGFFLHVQFRRGFFACPSHFGTGFVSSHVCDRQVGTPTPASKNFKVRDPVIFRPFYRLYHKWIKPLFAPRGNYRCSSLDSTLLVCASLFFPGKLQTSYCPPWRGFHSFPGIYFFYMWWGHTVHPPYLFVSRLIPFGGDASPHLKRCVHPAGLSAFLHPLFCDQD